MQSIKFVNGSEIKTIPYDKDNMSDIPMLIIGADIAKPDADDYSCVSYYCSSCKTIVSTNYFKNGIDNSEPVLPAHCPNCKVRFKGYMVSK